MSLGIYTTYSFALSAVRQEVEFERLWLEIAQETGFAVSELKSHLKAMLGHQPSVTELRAVRDFWLQRGELPQRPHEIVQSF